MKKKFIIGLGNPGLFFENTRHNLGFYIIDQLSKFLKFKSFEKKENEFLTSGILFEKEIFLIKPSTFMNNSGECIKMLLKNHKTSRKDIIIVYDDISLNLGKIRYRKKGSSGGHNGIKSIIEKLETDSFDRLKIGLGYNGEKDLKDWVIDKFSENEELEIKKIRKEIINFLMEWIVKKEL